MRRQTKKTAFLFGVLGLCAVLASCGQKPAAAELSTRDRAILSQQADARVVQATNAFGLELARRVMDVHPGDNIVVSPPSKSILPFQNREVGFDLTGGFPASFAIERSIGAINRTFSR